MIPGGFTPSDRPLMEQELQAPQDGQVRRSSGKSAWITLAIVVLVVVGMIVLLSFMPESTVTTTTNVPLPNG
jgi:flagellar basal body-associated protein FliL